MLTKLIRVFGFIACFSLVSCGGNSDTNSGSGSSTEDEIAEANEAASTVQAVADPNTVANLPDVVEVVPLPPTPVLSE